MRVIESFLYVAIFTGPILALTLTTAGYDLRRYLANRAERGGR